MNEAVLTEATEIEVHFYDVDSLQIVWHGNYIKYLENGREAFGKKYGISYKEIYDTGYVTPIFDLRIKYLGMVQLDDILVVETTYVPSRSAKLVFDYVIYKKSDKTVVVRATTIQLFMTKDNVFETSVPEFYRDWKQKWNV